MHRYFFSTLDGKEETGPTSTSGYAGTSLDCKVTLSHGIQIWSVPVTGRYIIEASGASGANGTDSIQSEWRIGGLGAKIEGPFALAKGAKLKILIGKRVTVLRTSVICLGVWGWWHFCDSLK